MLQGTATIHMFPLSWFMARSGLSPSVPRQPRTSESRDTVTRRVVFFRLVTKGEDGTFVPFSVNAALHQLQNLAIAAKYQNKDDGNALLSFVDSIGSRSRARLALIRRSDLPLVEEAGNLTPLTLGAGASLCEQTHLVFYPNSVVGQEFNFFGPRATSLAQYLPTIVPNQCSWLSVRALMRDDIVQQLNKLHSVKLFELRVRPADAGIVAQADADLGSAFRAAGRVAHPPTVGITLAPNPYVRGELLDTSFLGRMRALGRSRDLRATAAAFRVEGYDSDGAPLVVDLLEDKLVSLQVMTKLDSRSRALDSQSAYRAIDGAYAQLRNELETAASASLE